MRSQSSASLLILGAALFAAACGGSGSDTKIVLRDANAQLDTLLGPGDIRIFNDDSAIDLILVGDRISAGLSPKVVNKVRHKTAADTTRGSGFGAYIARYVKSTVASAIGTRVEYPLSDIQDIRYDNGGFVFDWKNGKHHNVFEHSDVNGRDADKSFSRDDAERFIAAVKTRKSALHVE